MNLFQLKETKLHSGAMSEYKIEADALTDEDLECLAYLVSKKKKFSKVYGVPRGGLRFAEKLKKYESNDKNDLPLIVDDVCSTGASLEEFANKLGVDCEGVVIFNRGVCPNWVEPIFQLMI